MNWSGQIKVKGRVLHTGLITLFLLSICRKPGLAGTNEGREFYTEFRYSSAEGIGHEKGMTRRDPSDVIKVGSKYYVWYTKTPHGGSGYDATIWYATSRDGKRWTEHDEALARGGKGAWDEHSVFTPNILVANDKYYLFYTAVPEPFTNDKGGPKGTKTAIGVAVSESPDGPWERSRHNPVLCPSNNKEDFDSHRVDDSCLLIRDGRYWLYYKGRQLSLTPSQTKMGVAIASKPEGPYVKSKHNPVIGSGHEVLVWPYREGVAALIGPTGPEKNTVQYAPDGVSFSVKTHIKNPPIAPGGYRPDAFTDTTCGKGMNWGISLRATHGGRPSWPYLVRFECDLGLRNATEEVATSNVQEEKTSPYARNTPGDDHNHSKHQESLKS